MKEIKAAIRELRAKAVAYAKLADALIRLGMFADRKPVRQRGGKRKISSAGRLAISQAQKRRWRVYRLANGAK